MSRSAFIGLLVALTLPAPSNAQRLGTNIELFGTASLVGGVTPVTAPLGSHTALHGGARIDGGVQFGRVGVGLGLRYWELSPTNEYGGDGLDVFFIGEWRAAYSSRTTFRGAFGVGFDDFDSGRGPERPTIGTDGIMWSVGIGRQVIAPSDIRFALTADLVVPQVRSRDFGRRRPVLEVGVGYRFSEFHPIGPLP